MSYAINHVQAAETQWAAYEIICTCMDECARAEERFNVAGKRWESMTEQDRLLYVEYFGCIFEFFGIVTYCIRKGKIGTQRLTYYGIDLEVILSAQQFWEERRMICKNYEKGWVSSQSMKRSQTSLKSLGDSQQWRKRLTKWPIL